MARSWLVAGSVLVVALFVFGGAFAQAKVEEGRRAKDCSQADNPERCAHAARLKAYCRENPHDEKCQDHKADMRRHCAHHPDDAKCQKHSDKAAHADRLAAYCKEHPDDAAHCKPHDDRMAAYCKEHPDDAAHCKPHDRPAA